MSLPRRIPCALPTMSLLWAAILLQAIPRFATGQIPCGYNVTEVISTPPCGMFQSNPTANAISPNGEYVAGYSSCTGGDQRAWVYRTATNQLSYLPLPPGFIISFANDVNDAGLIVGKIAGPSISRGFIFDLASNQYITMLEPLHPDGDCEITAINSSGWACGFRTIDGPIQDIIHGAFVLPAKGRVIDLGVMNGPRSAALDITENNIVVGWTGHGLLINDTYGFLWREGKTTIMDAIPGGLSSAAFACNNVPQVLLWGHTQPQPVYTPRTALWEDGVMTDLGILPGYQNVSGRSINNSSIVVGNCSGGTLASSGYLWSAGVMHPLSELIKDTAGLSHIVGLRINDLGQILGHAQRSTQQNVAFVAVPIDPTPGDTNCDGLVNITDVLEVIGSWGRCEGCVTDFTNDGTVNVPDLLFVIVNWTVF